MHKYQGSELPLFAGARNWKSYVGKSLAPFIGRDVLEVGAGIGGTTMALRAGRQGRWTCLEPDPELAAQLSTLAGAEKLGPDCRVLGGTVAGLPIDARYDSVIYMDVLEHIENDGEELALAARLLAPGGHLIVLAPAFSWLFTEFDEAVGHFRRYTHRQLFLLEPPGMDQVCGYYLDSVGLLASLANRMVFKSRAPTIAQILFWDKAMVPISRYIDLVIGRTFGRSVICIWRKR